MCLACRRQGPGVGGARADDGVGVTFVVRRRGRADGYMGDAREDLAGAFKRHLLGSASRSPAASPATLPRH